MRSLPQALLWETFSHGKWTLPSIFCMAIMLPLLVYGALSGLALDPSAKEFIALQVGLLQVVLVQLALGVAMAQGPVSRLYPLPISTNSIVAWHTFSGGLILALEMSATSWLLNFLFHVQWPILGPALYGFAAWSAVQVLMSVTTLQSLPALFFGGAPGVLLCFWINSRYGCYFSPPKYYWSEVTAADVLILLSAFAVCYQFTYYNIGLARSGERLPTLGIAKWIARKWDAYVNSRVTPPAFRSPAAAQFWFEWQVKGIALPLVTTIMLLFAIIGGIGALYLQNATMESLYDAVLFLGGFVSVLACAAGVFLGLDVDSKATGQRDTQLNDFLNEMQLESGMGSFLSCRPFSSKQFAAAIIKTAAYSSIVSWLIWLTVFVTCLLTLWIMKLSPTSYLPKEVGVLFIPMTILGPWIAMANLGMIGLSGRGTKILFTLVISGVGYCVFLGAIKHFTDVLIVMQIHTVFTTIAAVFVFIAAIWAFAHALKTGNVSMVTSALAALAFCGLVVAGVTLLPTSLTFIYYPSIVLFATFVVLPFACVPLAIAWNRHR